MCLVHLRKCLLRYVTCPVQFFWPTGLMAITQQPGEECDVTTTSHVLAMSHVTNVCYIIALIMAMIMIMTTTMVMTMIMTMALALALATASQVIWISIYSLHSSHRKYSLFLKQKALLHMIHRITIASNIANTCISMFCATSITKLSLLMFDF